MDLDKYASQDLVIIGKRALAGFLPQEILYRKKQDVAHPKILDLSNVQIEVPEAGAIPISDQLHQEVADYSNIIFKHFLLSYNKAYTTGPDGKSKSKFSILSKAFQPSPIVIDVDADEDMNGDVKQQPSVRPSTKKSMTRRKEPLFQTIPVDQYKEVDLFADSKSNVSILTEIPEHISINSEDSFHTVNQPTEKQPSIHTDNGNQPNYNNSNNHSMHHSIGDYDVYGDELDEKGFHDSDTFTFSKPKRKKK